MISVMSVSYNVGEVDEGDPLWILCPNTISIGVSNVDVDKETLVNIGGILNNVFKINSMLCQTNGEVEILHEVQPLLGESLAHLHRLLLPVILSVHILTQGSLFCCIIRYNKTISPMRLQTLS